MRSTIVLAVMLTSSIAAAQAPGQTLSFDTAVPPGEVTPTPAPATVSYRGQILAADGVSLGLTVVGPLLTADAQLSALGITGYFVAAPLVHLAHGRGGAAAKSFALRTVLPFAGALAGYRLGPTDVGCVQASQDGTQSFGGGCGHGSIVGMLVGIAAGGATAIAIDATHLARYQTRPTPTWTASVKQTTGGMTVSIGGSY